MDSLRTIICLVFLAGAASALTACSDSAACETTNDCFGGEVCRGGQCLVVADSDASTANNDTHTSNDGGTTSDGGGTDDDSGTTGDTGSPNNNNGGPECIADPFNDTCENDQYEPNEEWIDSEHVFDANNAFGCVVDFRPIDETISATLCPLEQADYFDFAYNTCKDYAYYIEFEFRPTNQCTAELVNFEFSNHSCEDDDTNCTPLENGGMRIQHIVAQTPVQSNRTPAYFGVTPGSTDHKVQVPYEISVRLYK